MRVAVAVALFAAACDGGTVTIDVGEPPAVTPDAASSGSHRVTVQAEDDTGAYVKVPHTIVVQ